MSCLSLEKCAIISTWLAHRSAFCFSSAKVGDKIFCSISSKMNITDHDKMLQVFLQRFNDMEERITSIETQLKSLNLAESEAKGKLVIFTKQS